MPECLLQAVALPQIKSYEMRHEKCHSEGIMPQIENAAQITGRQTQGVRMGLSRKEKQAATREYRPRYQKSAKKSFVG
jgi:hypothetical protein